MSNTLTGLIPTIYTAMDMVSRELIGFIPNVQRDAKAESAALNQTVRSHVVPAVSLENITPGATPADSGDHTLSYVDVTISNSKGYPIRWTGEEQKSVSQFGQYNTILADQFAQGFRSLANAVETDIGLLYKSAARAYGTAGTAPFGTAADLSDLAQINKILDDNGAPPTDRIIIVDSTARANLEGKHSELFKVNESGDAGALLRQRQMRMLQGFTMGYSAGVAAHTKGTGTSYQVNNASNYAAGSTTIAVDTGTGTIVAGDILTNTQAGVDSNKYVVGTALSAGSLAINAPGTLKAWSDNDTVAVGNSYRANLAFTKNAILLAARLPAMPEGGDNADDVMTITDPVSGLTFQIALYRQYRRIKIEIGLAWGVKAIKSEHMAILLG